MKADKKEELDSLTEQVRGAVFEVANTLGAGFLEKVYQRALVSELRLRGIRAMAEAPFTVTYKGHPVGTYVADLLIEDALVVELKCVEHCERALGAVHELSSRFGSHSLLASQFSTAQSRVEAYRARIPRVLVFICVHRR